MSTEAVAIKSQLQHGMIRVEDSPSPPKLLHEHSKTIITLATAFFGFSASLADRLLGQKPTDWQFGLLFAGWLLLLSSIIAAIVIVVQLKTFLSGKDTGAWKIAVRASTVSYVLLVVGVFVFGVLSGSQALRKDQSLDAGQSIKKAALLASSLPGGAMEKWRVQALSWQSAPHSYAIQLVTEPLDTMKTLCIIVHSPSGRVMNYRRC